MKRFLCTLCAIIVFPVVIWGCATMKAAEDAVSLTVEFAWTNKDKCSSVSPAMTVKGIPSNTVQLKIKMTDLDKMDFNHGGGTVKYEGSTVIPAGALKSYHGPCPPREPHDYAIRVEAVDLSGVIVGFGEKTVKCCP